MCKGELTLHDVSAEEGERVCAAVLRCLLCGRNFKVEQNIPRFVASQNYAAGFGLQWKLHARTQLDSYTKSDISERRFFQETRWPRRLTGETVLEVGSGAGRFTEQAVRTGAMVLSVDLSAAVDVNYAANGHHENVLIVQADVYNLPFRKAAFDKVFCFGVLQHTPDVEAAFKAVSSCVKPGGRLAVDVYRRHTGWKRLIETKRWVRPVSTRIPAETLYGMCRFYVRAMWPVAGWLHKVPRIGRAITSRLLIADYRGQLELGPEVLREWAILDTFDMLSPRYDSPQAIDTMRTWFEASGFDEIEVARGYNGIEGRGVKGHCTAPANAVAALS
jgi:SAM-dependent methyltransferase